MVLHACQSKPPQITTSSNFETSAASAIAQTTAEIYNPPRGDIRLVAISDLNGVYGATDYDPEIDKAIALLPFWQPDMVICGGDMIAGQKSSLSEAQLKAMWQAFDKIGRAHV